MSRGIEGTAMKASDIMTRKVVTVRPETTVAGIAGLLLDNKISAVPVTDEEGRVLGMVSEGDLLGRSAADSPKGFLLRLFSSAGLFLEEITTARHRSALDIMSKPAKTVIGETPLSVIAGLMRRHRFKHIPVVIEGKLAGIISRADVLKALVQDHQPTREHAQTAGLP